MELRDYLTILRDRWIAVVAFLLLGTLGAGVATLAATPEFEATSQVYVSVQLSDGSTQNLAQGTTYSQAQVAGFADLATSPLVLQPVIDDLGLPTGPSDLAESVRASIRLNTSLIDITATSTEPGAAAELSNAVADSMTSTLPELQRPLDSAVSPVRITITRAAVPPASKSSPDTFTNLAAGAALGLALGVIVAVLKTTLDTRVRSQGDLNSLVQSPLLGAVNFDPTTADKPLALLDDPSGPRAEAIRRIRTNLQFINAASRPQTVVVTSSLPGEGKSTTAANLALAMADAGTRVLLVDADLRRPTISRVMGIEGAVGLTTALIGDAPVRDLIQPYGETGLDILASGRIPPNPSELLGSRQMNDLLRSLCDSYEMIILDTAPLLPVTDGAVLSKLADGALVVVGADRAHRQHVTGAVDALHRVEANILGLVLNRATVTKRDNYGAYEYVSIDGNSRGNKNRRRSRPRSGRRNAGTS